MKRKPVAFDLTRFGGIGPVAGDGEATGAPENGAKTTSVPSVPRDRGIVYSRREDGGKKCESKTIRSARDTRDSRGQTYSDNKPPTFRYTSDAMQFGDICVGWTPATWAEELRRKADRCAEYRPDIADHYRRWAADIEARL